MVDFRKTKGEDSEFYKLYRNIYKHCHEIIRQPSINLSASSHKFDDKKK